MTRALLDDIETAGASARSSAKARTDAREASIRACRALEKALIHELDGEPLRGLANLGTAGRPYYAARVRGKPDVRLPLAPLSEAGRGKVRAAMQATGLLN